MPKRRHTEPWVNNGEMKYAPHETVSARWRMSQAGILLGALAVNDHIELDGVALGTWDYAGTHKIAE